MNKKTTIVEKINLADTKKGLITVSNINEPYGPKSKPIVSIGISIRGDELDPDWKAHIPYENLDDLINALNKIKDVYKD